MAVTTLKAQHMTDPAAARTVICNAFAVAEGNGQETARILGVSYYTLFRIIKSDRTLDKQIYDLRQQLAEQGVAQRGWGPSRQGPTATG
jgi:hypothetical protein